MELVGFSRGPGYPPLGAGYVDLSALTVVLGPNDSGKSTLLQLMLNVLGGEEPLGSGYGTAFFIRVDVAERDPFLAHCAGDLLRYLEHIEGFEQPGLGWSLGAW